MQQKEWQDLPSEIVRSVAERVSGVDDFLRLGAVCRPWSEALTGFRPPLLGQFPWLVPTAKLKSEEEILLPMYSPSNHRVNTFPVVPGGGGGGRGRGRGRGRRSSRIVGCHRGWLVAVDNRLNMYVFNPVTGDRASFPSLYSLEEDIDARDVFIKKVALSSTPPSSSASSGAGVAAAVVYCLEPENVYTVAFAEVGGRCCWTGDIELPNYLVSDAVYFRGNLFVVDIQGRYQIIEPPIEPKPPRLAVASQIPPMFCSRGSYFTFVVSPSSGHLLAVGTRSTTRLEFLVIKYNPPPSPHPSWVLVTVLGDEALFLDGGYTMLLPAAAAASSSSSSICTRRNCIYFIYGGSSDNDGFVTMLDAEKGVFEDPLLEQRSFMKNSSCWPLIKHSCWFLPSLS